LSYNTLILIGESIKIGGLKCKDGIAFLALIRYFGNILYKIKQ